MNDDLLRSNSMYGITDIDRDMLWGDGMQEVRDYLSNQVASNMDFEIIKKLKKIIDEPKQKTKEERVIDIVNGAFNDHFGMSLQEFQEVYEGILQNNPEKLV
jgi:hypothetical protein